MATNYSPKIVTDELVLCLDAANPKSYPGTGTTWFDLSGNNNNGTLSAETIGTTSSGVMTFNGVNTTISIPSPNLATSNCTVMGVAKRTVTGGRLISGGANNWLLGHWSSSSRVCYQLGWITASTGPNDSAYHIYASTANIAGDDYRFYDSNVEYTTIPTGGSAGPNGFTLGRYYAGTEFGTGEITQLLAYSRILSSEEMTQNFNALRGRYGI